LIIIIIIIITHLNNKELFKILKDTLNVTFSHRGLSYGEQLRVEGLAQGHIE